MMLWKTYPELCNSFDEPRVWGKPKTLDWTQKETTQDQQDIENLMEREGVEGKAILHMGIGNSSLAKKFSGKTSSITGCTVSIAEKAMADGFALPSYTVHVRNKYLPGLYPVVGGGYDVIVDNSLASFSCCRVHYRGMLLNYALALKVGGRVLTHRIGMNWAAGGHSKRKLTFDDLAALEKSFPFRASKITDDIFALTRYI